MSRIVTLGAEVTDEKYIEFGMRRTLMNFVMEWMCFFIITVNGLVYTKRDLSLDDVNYSYYLGQAWSDATRESSGDS